MGYPKKNNFTCLVLLLFSLNIYANSQKQIIELVEKANNTERILEQKSLLKKALKHFDNYDDKGDILQNPNIADLTFALSVYEKAIQINDSIFVNSARASHPTFINFQQETYTKNLALYYHIYKLTKNSIYAKNAFLLTENYKSIGLWRKDTTTARFNILQKKDLPNIQEKMAANQALISYHYGISNKKTDSSYVFVCTKNAITFQHITVNTMLITKYVNELNDSASESKTYRKVAYELYQNLFAPLILDTLKIKELTIFADGKLATMPFEALLTSEYEQRNFLKMPYLLKKYSIHYDLSLLFWWQQKQLPSEQNIVDNFLIMSPNFNKSQLSDLPHNDILAQNLYQNYEQTMFFEDRAASIPNFQKNAAKASVVHLASHAFLASKTIKEPYIVFSDAYLLASQLTKTSFANCHLAVLACCETGNGNYEKGIGIRSLNYSFRKNGVKSVIASLWSVDDETTSQLLQNFYTFLAQGKSKNVALQAAKLKYLEQRTEYDTPYYWAGLVLNGQNGAVVLKEKKSSKQQQPSFYYLLGILATLTVFIFIFLALRTKTKP